MLMSTAYSSGGRSQHGSAAGTTEETRPHCPGRFERDLTNSAPASQRRLAVEHGQQGIVIVHEKTLVAPASPIPGLPILAHAIVATPLKRPLRKGLQHREKHLIRLFNPP